MTRWTAPGVQGTVEPVSDRITPGRPRRQAEASSEARVEVRCTPDEKALWTEKAADEGRSLSDVVRSMLQQWSRGTRRAKRG